MSGHFNWPTGFLIITVLSMLGAAVAPWFAAPRRWRPAVTVLSAAGATCLWLWYEAHLRAIAPPGDPLIRIDLIAIYPALGLVWISAAASIAWSASRRATV